MCRVRTRSKREASSQNLTRKTSHMLNIPYNFLNGFELISKMTCGTSQSAEIRRSAEKSHVWTMWGLHIFHQKCEGYIYFTNNVGATYISPTMWRLHIFHQQCGGYIYSTNNVGVHIFHQQCGGHIYFTNDVGATYISPTMLGLHIFHHMHIFTHTHTIWYCAKLTEHVQYKAIFTKCKKQLTQPKSLLLVLSFVHTSLWQTPAALAFAGFCRSLSAALLLPFSENKKSKYSNSPLSLNNTSSVTQTGTKL